jgi:hypothetical protein
MAIARPVLMVELLMSADRVITAAEAAAIPAHPDVDWWSPATVVGHLSQVDLEVWLRRLELMVEARHGAERPSFAWWEPDADETRRAFGDLSTDDAAARLLASRTSLLLRVRDLTDDDWSARADHDTFGPIDVEGLLLQVLAHDEEHRASLLLGQPDQ